MRPKGLDPGLAREAEPSCRATARHRRNLIVTGWRTGAARADRVRLAHNEIEKGRGGGELYRLHRRDLQATDVTSVDGIPVTTVARTIKDCLDTGTDPYQLRAAIERAEAEGTLRRAPAAELRAALDEPATGLKAHDKGASA